MCLQLAGVLLGALGTFAQAKASSDAAKASANQNAMNKVIAQNNANDARDEGVVEYQDVQLRNRARIGTQQNTLSERGISVSEGSPLDILGDTAAMGKLDELTVQNNAERKAVAYETQSINYDYQSRVDKMTAKNAMTAGVLGAFGDAATGVGKIAAQASGGSFKW